LLPGCSKQEPVTPAAPVQKILRLSHRNEPATLDPQLATLPDEFFIIRALKEGLLVPNPGDGAPLPGVAERWEVSADGLTWTFHLRVNARWSSGRALTAQDFVYSIHRALTSATAASKAQLFFSLAGAEDFYRGKVTDPALIGAEAAGPQTLVLRLARPNSDLPALVASGPWIPVYPHVTIEDGKERFIPGRDIGNGPFVVTEWHANQHITVSKNPHYHAADRVKLDGLRFQAFDSGDTEERAFRAGQVDVTLAVPFSKLGSYTPPTLQTQPLHETRYLALNTTRPPLDNPKVRRALALAIDRRALVDQVTRGGQRPALSFIPPGLGGYAPEKTLEGSIEEARSLLAATGFPGGKGFPRLEISTWVNTPVLEAIQQMWKRELGLDVAIVQREGKVHLAAAAAGDFDLAFLPAIPDYAAPAALFEEWLGTSPVNYARWRNAGYDRLVLEAGRTTDAARRLALYREAEALMLADLPVIPLYFNTQNFLLSPRVHGWHSDGLWTRFYTDLILE
jgi:oligopeptide transport system substrate-binding protein